MVWNDELRGAPSPMSLHVYHKTVSFLRNKLVRAAIDIKSELLHGTTAVVFYKL